MKKSISLITAFLITIQVFGQSTPLNGTYTLGDSISDFPTFTDAIDALDSVGVDGPVIFNIKSGVYNEQVEVGVIQGTSSTNTVTFQSESGLNTDVIIEHQPYNGDFVFRLNGSNFVSIKNITIKATGIKAGILVELRSGASNNLIEGNIIENNKSDAASKCVANPSSSIEQFNIFRKNQLINGHFGFCFEGNNNNDENGNLIEDNKITGFVSYGIFSKYQDSITARSNIITNASLHTDGIYFRDCDHFIIVQNKIIVLGNDGDGIYIGLCMGETNNPNVVSNNFIVTGGINSINSYGSNYTDFYYNSINNLNTSSYSRAFVQAGTAPLNLRNNIFCNYGGGYSMILNIPNCIQSCDYNNFYSSGPILSLWNNDTAYNLNELQNISGYNLNSVSIFPPYVSDTNLYLKDASFFGLADTSTGILIDIDGNPRSITLPTIGAHEFVSIPYDAGVTKIIQPVDTLNEGDIIAVKVIVSNYGLNTINNMDISFFINNGSPITQSYSNPLPPSTSDTVTLADITISQSNSIICAYTNCPGDSNLFNDRQYASYFGRSLYNASLVDMENISGGCYLVYDTVKIFIRNDGLAPINSGLTASYQIGGVSTIVTEAVTNSINPNDTILFSFTNLVDLSVTTTDSLFNIKSWVDINGDIYHDEDTGTISVISLHKALPPIVSDTIIHKGTTAVLHAISQDSIFWYASDTSIKEFYTGPIYQTPVLFDSITYWVETTEILPVLKITEITQHTSGIGATPSYPPYITSFFEGVEITNMGIVPADLSGYTMNFYGGMKTSWTFPDGVILMPGDIAVLNTEVSGNHNIAYNYFILNLGGVSSNTPQCYWLKNKYGTLLDAVATNGATFPFYSEVTANDWSGNIPSSQGNAGVVRIFSDNNNASDWANSDSITQTIGSVNPSLTGISHIEKSCPSDRIPVRVFIKPPYADDTGIDDIISPTGRVPSNIASPVQILLRNNGSDTLKTVTINWELDGISKQSYQWSGNLLQDSVSLPVTIATDTFQFGYHNLKIWTSLPNSNIDSLNLNDTIQSSFIAELNGSYSVGNQSSDFLTIMDAVDMLDSVGVGGPVIFNIEAGIYEEQLCINEVIGASVVNTISFQSITADSTSVILFHEYDGTNGMWTVKLDGADYIIFKHMTVKGTGNYSYPFELTNGASYNEIENNIIQCKWGAYNNYAIYEKDSINPYNKYRNNAISNCWSGLFIENNNSLLINYGTIVENNIITRFERSGIRIYYSDSLVISNNFIKNYYASQTEAICLSQCNYYQIVNNIVIINSKYSYSIGLQLLGSNGLLPANRSLIANNFISISNSAGDYDRGIFVRDCNHIDIYHNSINIVNDITVGGGSAIFFDNGGHINSKNNIFNMTSGASTLYFEDNIPVNFDSDYNNLFTKGSNLVYWKGYYPNLDSFRIATGQELHSLSVDPEYISSSNLHSSSIDLDSAAIPVPSVITDIDGDVRDSNFPDIGADEFTIVQNDAGIKNILELPLYPSSGIQDVKICLKNYGFNILSSAIINLSINGNNQPPYFWAGNLSPNEENDSLLIGQFYIPPGYVELKVWTSIPNGQLDGIPDNDTSLLSIITCQGPLSGIYTIGGNNSAYKTFNDAIEALTTCGVGGPVVFNIEPGMYEEQIKIPPITGASLNNTITFQSSTGDSTSVTLFYSPLKLTRNYIINLNGADYIRIKNLTIKSTTHTSYGNVIMFSNEANYNEISNNIIEGTNSWDAACIVDSYLPINYISVDNYNIIKDNLITRGRIGISLSGDQYSITNEKGNIIEGNIITDFKETGIQLKYQDSVTVASNTIYKTESNGTSWHCGIYLDRCSNTIAIMNNDVDIEMKVSASEVYGIYSADCYNNNNSLMANNMVSISGFSNNIVGIKSFYSGHKYYIYNSIHIDCNANYQSPFEIKYYSDTINIINNVFSIESQGNACHVVHSLDKTNIADYNDINNNGQLFAVWNTQYPDLQSLQAGTGTNLNSVSVDPGFVSNNDLHIISNAVNGLGTPLSVVTTDIDGDIRDSLNPDIGADEFNAYNLDAALIAFLQPDIGFDTVGSTKNVEVVIKNLGIDTISGFDVGYSILGYQTTTEQYTDTLFPLEIDTFLFTNHFVTPVGQFIIKSFTILPGDQVLSNDTITKAFTGLQTIQTAYFNDFDGGGTKVPGDVWISVPFSSQWEHGIPNANTINNAFSGSKVWATVLDSTYSNKRTSYLYSPIFDLNSIGVTSLKFWHWICSEPQNDGGYIEYLNNQNKWMVLGQINDPSATNWYNTSKGGKHFWSGKSNGWIYSTYNLDYLNDFGDIIQFRYVFTSNINIVNDGWAIDNFELGMPVINKDVGVNHFIYPDDTTIANSNVYIQVQILNFGSDTLLTSPISYSVDGGPIITETWNGILPANTSDVYKFSMPFTSPLTGNYHVKVFTSLQTDQYNLNDTITREFISSQNIIFKDVGITKIYLPLDTTLIGKYEQVEVEIKNFGTEPLYSIPLQYSINGGQSILQSWAGSLQSNDSTTFTFFTPFALSTAGTYDLCVESLLLDDFNPVNNVFCRSLYSDTSSIIHDAGISSIISPLDTTIIGTYEKVTVIIQNFGMDTLISIPLSYKINNWMPIDEEWNGILIPNSSATFTFNTSFLTPSDNFEICVYTRLDFDLYATNDTLCRQIINNPFISVFDIGINSIISPGDSTDTGTLVDIAVEIKNNGNDTLLSSPISYNIDGGIPINETWNGFMLPSEIDTFTFNTQLFTSMNSLFEICVYSTLANDVNAGNDSICKSVVNLPVISINEKTVNKFWLGQNIPNPAYNTTTINYSVPHSSKVIFRVIDAIGKMIYSRSWNSQQGMNSIVLDLSVFNNGIYYYLIEYKGKVLLKKMVVSK